MALPIVVGPTGEIRSQLAAAQAALTELEALLAPMPGEAAGTVTPSSPEGGRSGKGEEA